MPPSMIVIRMEMASSTRQREDPSHCAPQPVLKAFYCLVLAEIHSSCKAWLVFILPRLCVFFPTLPALGASKVDRYRVFCGTSASDTQSPGPQSHLLFAHIPYEGTLQCLVPMCVSPLLVPKSISDLKRLSSDLPWKRFPKLSLLPHDLVKRTCFKFAGLSTY